jgi:hypothetical protein
MTSLSVTNLPIIGRQRHPRKRPARPARVLAREPHELVRPDDGVPAEVEPPVMHV